MEAGSLEDIKFVQHVRNFFSWNIWKLYGSTTLLPSTGSTELPAKLDVVRVDLQPSEQYKSVCLHNIIHTHVYTAVCVLAYTCQMLLAGQRPEVIMEICSRAMSFWTYQVSYELSG